MANNPRVLVSARVHDRQVGGNTRYVREVYKRLPVEGIEFTLARPKPGLRGTLRTLQYAAAESLIWPLVARGGVHSLIHYPADTGAVARARIPIVSTVHGLATLHMHGVRSATADTIWRSRVRALLSVSDAIVTVSKSSAEDIVAFFPAAADRIRIIPHGIDHARFNPLPCANEVWHGIEGRLNLPEKYFLYVGNLDPRKNVIELAKAASAVFGCTGIPLVVAGAPAWDSAAIQQAVETTRGVMYIGRVADEDLVPLMQHALAFVFPSLYEGFGFPVLEAMATGTPVICSNKGSLREVASDAALIVEDLSADGIAAAMLAIVDDTRLRTELGRKGIANASDYQWSRSAHLHATLFREVSK